MKTIEEKAKAYDEAIENFRRIKNANKDNTELVSFIEYNYPELAKSEDDKIRKRIINALIEWSEKCSFPGDSDDMINWLEKQDSQTIKEALRTEYEKGRADAIAEIQNPTRSDEMKNSIIHCQESLSYYYRSGMITIDEYNSAKNLLNSLITNTWKPSYKQMIQWTGNNLKEVIDFTGKSQNFDKWFKNWEDFEQYVHSHNNILKLFNEDGSHYEVPIGVWIVKTPDGYNVPSKAKYIQKPADNIEPKFKVGDWIISDKAHEDYRICKIIEVKNGNYKVESIYGYSGYNQYKVFDNIYRLWTIKDAKDGDVLATLDYILIFKQRLEDNGGMSYCHYDFGAGNPQFIWLEDKNWYFGKEAIIYPATKEQHDLLFQKMKEAGYEWDVKKKELRKIEQKPANRSEDDEKIRKELLLDIPKVFPYDKAFRYIAWLEEQKSYTFNSIPRLLGMIKPTDRAKEYCQKLIYSLEEEGYNADAKIVRGILKQWNGEEVPMAIMDEQKHAKWSEEDETGWSNTMIMIKECASHHYTKNSIKLVIDWLESIYRRFH